MSLRSGFEEKDADENTGTGNLSNLHLRVTGTVTVRYLRTNCVHPVTWYLKKKTNTQVYF